MCIYCIEGDMPLHLRKSAAFPRKVTTEAVEMDAAASRSGSSGAFSCDSPEPQAEPVAVWPKRKNKP